MPRGAKLDSYDIAILSALQANGWVTEVVVLAETVHLSPSPCWERLKKLEGAGLITGYHAMVETTLSNHNAEDFRRFEAEIQVRDEVQGCWALGGGIDYILRLIVANVDAYQRLMVELLDGNAGIERYFGYFVAKTVKYAPGPIPEG